MAFPQPSWNPISSCFLVSASSLWMASAVYFVPCSRDYEERSKSSEAMVQIAMIQL
jgi:hypothetical protein